MKINSGVCFETSWDCIDKPLRIHSAPGFILGPVAWSTLEDDGMLATDSDKDNSGKSLSI